LVDTFTYAECYGHPSEDPNIDVAFDLAGELLHRTSLPTMIPAQVIRLRRTFEVATTLRQELSAEIGRSRLLLVQLKETLRRSEATLQRARDIVCSPPSRTVLE
jgi:hypothetical protein